MRVSILAFAILAFVACSVVDAKPHKHASVHSTVHVNGTATHRVQEGRAWLLDASVVNQGSTNLSSSDAWVLYKQCGESWSNDRIGTSSTTICAVGCAMSSVAMALKTKGTDVNPGTLNQWLIGHGGYEGGDELVWGSVSAFGTISFYDYYHGPGSISQSALQGVIAKGWPVVVNVRSGSHWVLVTGHASGSTYRVNDPGFPSTSYEYSDMSNFVVYS